MTTMAMFPLASVLFPGMPMALRVFEDRYLVMMSRVLQQDSPEFGIVLIERGSEAGGGEQRFDGVAALELIRVLAGRLANTTAQLSRTMSGTAIIDV